MKFNKDIKFNFEGNAFDVQNERLRIRGNRYEYNQDIEAMNGLVDKLDRLDDFSMLQIPVKNFRKDKGNKYGIEFNPHIHYSGEVILPEQKKTALEFLKSLRGFGLLADVVGSGKTYEAGVVLSELAIRNKVKSMLIIVPTQVYSKWKSVLELEFGIGEGVIQEVGDKLNVSEIERYPDDHRRPLRPILVRDKDFATWSDETSNLIFDVIVVDEAHNLCQEAGEYAKAMKLLSLMMKTKREAGSTYCVLLSATPHSGNLDSMFRLWYYVRCKGGNPSDFDEKDDRDRTQSYRDEKEYYRKIVCHDAITVMDFIKNVKVKTVEQYYMPTFVEYLNSINSSRKYYENANKIEKLRLVNEFMDSQFVYNDDEAIRKDVIRKIASAYYNGVLRTIMIRRGSNDRQTIERNISNVFYYPTTKDITTINIVDFNNLNVVVDCANLESDTAVKYTVKGKNYSASLKQYCEDFCKDRSVSDAYSVMIKNIMFALSDIDNKDIYRKKNTIRYYDETISKFPKGVGINFKPIKYIDYDSIEHKYNDLVEILRKHKDNRVVIFFDYDNKNNSSIQVRDRLEADPEFASRLVVADSELGATYLANAEKTYNNNKNAILLCLDAAFTEGANLQKGNIVINFEVTPDPLAMNQRIGRVARIGQANDIYIYSLADMNKLEGYALAYLSIIGILSSNDSDATIISGSSNEKMISIRCPHCGFVKMISVDEYNYAKTLPVNHKTRIDLLYCQKTSACVSRGKVEYFADNKLYRCAEMSEITIHNFKCDTCQSTFTRSLKNDGYLCMARNNDFNAVMCSDISTAYGESSRKFYCNKVCALAHCSVYTSGRMKGKCLVVKEFEKNRNLSLPTIKRICDQLCQYQGECDENCRPYNIGAEAIEKCQTCHLGGRISCSTGAHILEFNEHWEASCPVCRTNKSKKKGKLQEVIDSTFNKYIRESWNFDGDDGESFVDSLLKEVHRVDEIRLILELDEEVK